MRNSWLWIPALSLAVGCSGASNDELNDTLSGGKRDAAVDAGEAVEDGGVLDAAALDAALQDAGVDAGELDAAEPDASEPDAAVLDAMVDAEALDATADATAPDAGPQTVAELDFEQATLPAGIDPGTGVLTPSQGFEPYGPVGNTFGPTFLRSPTNNTITLTLVDLPQHSSLSLEFLFAAIDSLDGAGSFPAGDYFRVTVDGVPVFGETFANALESQIQTYVAPAGVTLARHANLGFGGPGGYYTDSAYDLGKDPIFQNLPHTAGSVSITFALTGEGVQDLTDESWAIDNVRVLLGNTPKQPDAGPGGS